MPGRQVRGVILACVVVALGCDTPGNPVAPSPQPVPSMPPPSPGSFLLIQCEPGTQPLLCHCYALRFRADERRDVTAQALWQSSNPSAVVVSAGVVRRTGLGRSTLTVRFHWADADGGRDFLQTHDVASYAGGEVVPLVTLLGHVSGKTPNGSLSLEGALVELTNDYGERILVTTDRSGDFRIGIVPGVTLIRITRDGYAPLTTAATGMYRSTFFYEIESYVLTPLTPDS